MYVLRRVAEAVAVVWATFTLTFFLLYWMPGDPVQLMLAGGNGGGTYVDPAAMHELRAKLGLDHSWIVQYLTACKAVLSGDLGYSIAQGQPVLALLESAIPSTLNVSILGLLFAALVGVGIAFGASYWRGRWISGALLAFPATAVALPPFWVGIVLIQIFSFHFRIFPAFGSDSFASDVLPALTLGLYYSATIAQALDAALREVEVQPFIHTALARGSSRLRILILHIARNSATISLTMLGTVTGGLLAGAMITETVFARSGIGTLLVSSVTSHDFPVILATVVFVAACYTSINLLVDLIVPFIDPKLRSTAFGK